MKVLAGSVSAGSHLPDFQMAVSSLCPHMPFLDVYTLGERKRDLISDPNFIKSLIPS